MDQTSSMHINRGPLGRMWDTNEGLIRYTGFGIWTAVTILTWMLHLANPSLLYQIIWISLLVAWPVLFASSIMYMIRGSEDEAEIRAIQRMQERRFKVPKRLAKRINADENLWLVRREHVIVLARWHVPSLILAVLALWFLPFEVMLYAWGLILAVNFIPLLRWSRRYYGFTDTRIIMIEGIIRSNAPYMPLKNSQEFTEIVPAWSVILTVLRFLPTRVGTLDPQSNVPEAMLTDVSNVADVVPLQRMVYQVAKAREAT